MTDKSLEMLKEVRGIGDSALENFREAGFENLEDLKGLSRKELKDVQGVGSSTANSIIRLLEREDLRRKKPRTENQEKLQDLLRELFQFDNSELDFGIYRIMNQKRDEIEKFIDKQLLDVVDEEFEKYESENVQKLEDEIDELKEEIKDNFGEDAIDENDEVIDMYKGTPLGEEYMQKRKELKEVEVSEPMEAQIFNDLYNFFKHYYEDGDFVTKRRYSRKNKYAVPYNGEEVYLHWANKEQYYVKTAERFKDYRFRLPDDYYVQFQLKNAEVDQNNAKGDKKYFLLHSTDPINYDSENKTLHVQFEYRPLTDLDMDDYGLSESSRKNTKADNIREEIIERIMEAAEDKKLLREALEHTERGEEKTILEKNLYQYTKKHTSDYFIHKNLGEFLRRELDFYIKNEIVHLDDLGSAKERDVEQYMGRVRIVKKIAKKIIDFLEQIENFQKKLWEKKKFVVQSDYCITLDKIPEEYYSEILENEEQIEEWKELYKLDESMEGSIEKIVGEDEIDEDFLENHKSMMIDTKFYNEEFKDKLLAEFDNLEDEIEGNMIKSENFQGMDLITEKYRKDIDVVYIDPPYNTKQDEFEYKDNYEHSSWLTMMYDRIRKSLDLANLSAPLFVSIDDHEVDRLSLMMEDLFHSSKRRKEKKSNFVGRLPTIQNLKGNNDEYGFAGTHEYTLAYLQDVEKSELRELPVSDKDIEEEYNLKDDKGRYKVGAPLKATGRNAPREKRPNLFYPIWVGPNDEISVDEKENFEKLLPKTDGQDMSWRWSKEYLANHTEDVIVNRGGNELTLYKKQRLNNQGVKEFVQTFKPKSILYKPKYSSTTGTGRLKDILGSRAYSNPKSVGLIEDLLLVGNVQNGFHILDFFAGSGTTGEAVINLKERYDDLKFTLIEMADYFEDVLKPRILKVTYSDEWNEGEPGEIKNTSSMFRYQKIEQYEDTLNNIKFSQEKKQQRFQGLDDYLLNYMLEFETRDSSSLLNIDQLKTPFNYKLKIKERDETKNKVIDIPETFNYLIGLEVSKRYTKENEDRKYLIYRGKVDDEFTIVIWRNTEDIDLDEDKDVITNEILKGYEENIYINQENVIENSIPIEKIFKNKMEG